ncbi:hypothetical protein [uncultured Nostoc sp.]|uniref:hypothetical protein n=1 Tax=uncultured Nostoc sp. TaxID=340711 RepID=UPI0035CAE0A3
MHTKESDRLWQGVKQSGFDGRVIVKVAILLKEGVKLKPKITIADHLEQIELLH